MSNNKLTDDDILKAVKAYEEKLLSEGLKCLEPFEVREIVERLREENIRLQTENAEQQKLIDRLQVENGFIRTKALFEDKTTATAISAEYEQHRITTEYIQRLKADNERLTQETTRLQNIVLRFLEEMIIFGNKNNIDTTNFSFIPILESESESIVKQLKAEIKTESYKECIERAKKELAPFVTNVPDMCEVLNNLLNKLVGDRK